MSKPSVFTLAGESKNFVFSNLGVLKEHATILFPIVLVLELINSIGVGFHMQWMPLVTIIPSLVVYACFALSWHRVALVGVDVRPVNPFHLGKADWGFVGIFFALMFLPFLIMFVGGFVLGFLAGLGGNPGKVIFGLAIIPLCIWIIIITLRFSFFLPARSVGVKLSYAEAKRSSKGLLWPFFGSSLLFGLMYLIPLLIYGIIVAAILGTAALEGNANTMTPSMALVQFIITVPVLAANFILAALNITALSRAYQWGIKNNPIEPGQPA